MLIVNVIEIPFEIKRAETFFSRFKGLMFRKSPIQNEGLWISPCNAIHMFFMSFPIDVVLLNEHMQIVSTISGIKPWRVTRPVPGALSTLELPAGTIEKLGITVGDHIRF